MTDLTAVFNTSRGTIRISLFAEQVPNTVANFVNLIERGYYDGLNFHRVIPNFMIQGGCPNGVGNGSPGYRFADEFDSSLRHDRPGILSMANAGPATNGSQFFICHGPQPHLDGKHAVFGVTESAEDQAVVDAVQGGDTIESATIEGDTSALKAQCADVLAEWNAILNDGFPALKPAS